MSTRSACPPRPSDPSVPSMEAVATLTTLEAADLEPPPDPTALLEQLTAGEAVVRVLIGRLLWRATAQDADVASTVERLLGLAEEYSGKEPSSVPYRALSALEVEHCLNRLLGESFTVPVLVEGEPSYEDMLRAARASRGRRRADPEARTRLDHLIGGLELAVSRKMDPRS